MVFTVCGWCILFVMSFAVNSVVMMHEIYVCLLLFAYFLLGLIVRFVCCFVVLQFVYFVFVAC